MGVRNFPVCIDIWKTLISAFPAAITPQKIKRPFPKTSKLRNIDIPILLSTHLPKHGHCYRFALKPWIALEGTFWSFRKPSEPRSTGYYLSLPKTVNLLQPFHCYKDDRCTPGYDNMCSFSLTC